MGYSPNNGGAGEKKGRAPNNAADNLHGNSTPSFVPVKPKSQREFRCLKALARAADGVMRRDLDAFIGTQNAPEYISRLRTAGWEIRTERVPVVDRDGKKISVGRYRLASSQRETALEVISGLEAQGGGQ